jgi:hypothetical protein
LDFAFGLGGRGVETVSPDGVAATAGEALVAEFVRVRKNVEGLRRGRADALWRQRRQIMVRVWFEGWPEVRLGRAVVSVMEKFIPAG